MNNEVFDLSQIFIGREQQLDLFQIYLNRWKQLLFNTLPDDTPATASPSPHNKIQGLIVLLYGHGGFGKSTLLRKYRDFALKENQHSFFGETIVSKIIDWEFAAEGKRNMLNPPEGQAIDATVFFNILCAQLADALNRDIKQFREYQIATKAVELAAKEARGVFEHLGSEERYGWLRELAVEGIKALVQNYVPWSKAVFDNSQVKKGLDEAAKFTQEQLSQVRAKLHDKLGTRLGDFLDPALRLGLALGRDLAQFATNFPLLIFFDTYEEIDLGDNLLRIVMSTAGLRVGWVVAGRGNLWAGLDQARRTLDMDYGYKEIVSPDRGLPVDFNVGGVGAFTFSDIKEFFDELCKAIHFEPSLPSVTEDEAKRILDVTLGIPLAVKIAAGLYLETADLDTITEDIEGKREVVDKMVQRYLLHTRIDRSERVKLYGLALLRRADHPASVAAALGLSLEEAKASYTATLSLLQRRYSFIFTEKDEPSLHQEVRHFLRLWLLERCAQPEIVAINDRLRQAQETALKNLEEQRQYGHLQERLEDDDWVSVYLDLIERQFWLDPPTCIIHYCLPFMFAAAIYNRNANREVADIGEFFETHMKQPYRDYWHWATTGLATTPGWFFSPGPEELSALEKLAKLTSQRCPTFPQPIPDYGKELEATLWWRIGETYKWNRNEGSTSGNEMSIWYEKALTVLGENDTLKKDASDAYLNRGITYHKREEYERAWTDYTRALQLNPESAEAYHQRGHADAGLNDDQRALEDFSRAIELDRSPSTHLYLCRGITYRNLKRYEQALEDFNQALQLDPDYADAYLNRGHTYYWSRELEQALEDYTQAIQLNAKNAYAYLDRGNTYRDLKRYEQALEDFNQALQLDPKNVDAYLNRGNISYDLQEYERALVDYNQAIALNPVYGLVYLNRGNTYLGLTKYEQALADYTQAIELDPKNAEAYVLRGRAYQTLQKYEQALEDSTQAIEINPESANAYHVRGHAYAGLADSQRALGDFNRSIELEPQTANFYICRGLFYLGNLNDSQRALEDLDYAIKQEPESGKAFVYRGMIYLLLNENVQGLKDLDHASGLDPQSAWTFMSQGFKHFFQGEYQQFVEKVDHAVRSISSFDSPGELFIFIFYRGLAYYYLGDMEKALEDFNHVAQQAPQSPLAYISRGLSCNIRGEDALAIEEYTSGLTLNSKLILLYMFRGGTYLSLEMYQQALEDFDAIIMRNFKHSSVYFLRAETYRLLKDYQRALADYDWALNLDPQNAQVYDMRGYIYLELKDIEQAIQTFRRGWELSQTDPNFLWMAEWAGMGQQRPGEEMARRLEEIAAVDSQDSIAGICRAVALGLHGKLKEGLAKLEQVISPEYEDYDAYFWQGMFLAYMGRDSLAVESIKKSLAADLPPILLTPLRWLEKDRPEFFERYVRPLFEHYDI